MGCARMCGQSSLGGGGGVCTANPFPPFASFCPSGVLRASSSEGAAAVHFVCLTHPAADPIPTAGGEGISSELLQVGRQDAAKARR